MNGPRSRGICLHIYNIYLIIIIITVKRGLGDLSCPRGRRRRETCSYDTARVRRYYKFCRVYYTATPSDPLSQKTIVVPDFCTIVHGLYYWISSGFRREVAGPVCPVVSPRDPPQKPMQTAVRHNIDIVSDRISE